MPDEVIEAANFEKHEFKPTLSAQLAEQGYHIGAKVKLVRRVSVKCGKASDKFRKDLQEGKVGVVKGATKDDMVAVTFEVRFHIHTHTVGTSGDQLHNLNKKRPG
jgi:hypothetical protein